MGLNELLNDVNNKYSRVVRPNIEQGNYGAAYYYMDILCISIEGAIHMGNLPLFDHHIRALALSEALKKREKETIDAAVARFEELLNTPISEITQQ